MITESYKKSASNYNKASKLYDELNNMWHEISSGEAKNVDYKISEALRKVNEFEKLLSGIDMDDIEEKITGDKLKRVKENIDLYREAAYYIKRDLKSTDYADDLKGVVDNYFDQLGFTDTEFKKWGGYNEAVKKFVSAITHPDRVLDYENEIKRLIKGKMTTNEFDKIFSVLQDKMTKKPPKKSKDKDKPPKSEIPPEMWSEEKKKEYYKKSKERWSGVEKGKEEKAKEHGISAKPPKKEFKKDRKYYLVTPEGVTKQYFSEVKGKDGIIRYMDKEGNIVYSYVYEGFMPFNAFQKLIRS